MKINFNESKSMPGSMPPIDVLLPIVPACVLGDMIIKISKRIADPKSSSVLYAIGAVVGLGPMYIFYLGFLWKRIRYVLELGSRVREKSILPLDRKFKASAYSGAWAKFPEHVGPVSREFCMSLFISSFGCAVVAFTILFAEAFVLSMFIDSHLLVPLWVARVLLAVHVPVTVFACVCIIYFDVLLFRLRFRTPKIEKSKPRKLGKGIG